MGKSHKLDEKEATLKESFLSYKIRYICSVVRHGVHKPCICCTCYACIEQIDVHLNHVHQIQKASKYRNAKKKIIEKKFTSQFEANFSNIDDEDDNNTCQEELDENENELQTNATPKHTQKPINKDKLRPLPPKKRQNQNQQKCHAVHQKALDEGVYTFPLQKKKMKQKN